MGEQSASELISRWLQGKPSWYSYALHIALQGSYSTVDVEALAKTACENHGIDLGIKSNASLQSYSPDDLANVGMSERNVVLKSITARKGVNALLPESEINFAMSGLTVVYGKNGSGKSGFSRIVRNASTSRSGSEPILPNVFEKGSDVAISITAMIDDDVKSFSWENEKTASYPHLPEISFFDSKCASREVDARENDFLYTPKIVEALTRFAQLITEVADRVKQEEEEIKPSLDQRSIPAELSGLSLVQGVLSCDSLDSAAHLVEDAKLQQKDADRMASIPKLIESDASVEIPKLNRRLTQLNEMRSHLVSLLQCCSEAFAERYANAKVDFEKARGVSHAAKELFSKNAKLSGIGDGQWRALWEAARRYSNEIAYPSAKYPNVEEGALCPLCQQPLSEDAAHRMRSFEDYVTGSAEKNLEEKEARLHSLNKEFLDAVAFVAGDKSALGILESENTAKRMESLIRTIDGVTTVPDIVELTDLSEEVREVGTSVRAEIDGVQKNLESIQKSLQPGEVERLKGELLALKGREWISNNSDSILADAEKRATKKLMNAIRGECGTRSISSLVSDVSKNEMVERMRDSFNTELAMLRASNQHVSMVARVRGGREYQRIALDGTTEKATNVLSEGEQKIVALAGFFALLDVMPSRSTVVLDDPVTSLDHDWREVVAARIASEARRRPVVVFTHEPLFCVCLSSLAKEAEVDITYRTVYKRGSKAGIVSSELDWDATNVKGRISNLRSKAVDIRRMVKSGSYASDSDRDDAIKSCYSKLRSAWERAVEEVLLGGVIQRAQVQVHTQQLKYLDDIVKSDIDAVASAMTKCSKVTDAHDDPLAAPSMVPDIEELEQDIEELASWRQRIVQRRKGK